MPGGPYFISLLAHALIEREIRNAMATEQTPELALYPEHRACRAPTAARVLEIFDGITAHRLLSRRTVVQVFEPTLSPLQLEVLGLLGISADVYTTTSGRQS